MSLSTQILYGGAIASLAVILTKFYSPFSKKNKAKLPENSFLKQEIENEKELEQLREMQQLLEQKSLHFEVQFVYGRDVLEKKCLTTFFQETVDLFDGREVTQLYSQNREGRRKVFNVLEKDYETYFKFVYTLDENIKYIIEKTQKDFAVFLNLDYNTITQSVAEHMNNREDGGHFRKQIIELMSQVRESLKNYLPLFKKPIPPKKILEIMDFQIYILQEKEEYLLEIIEKIGISCEDEEESLPVFLGCYLEDTIWEKFGVEIQQLTVVNSQFDEELINKFEELKRIQEKITIKMINVLNREVFEP